MKNNAPEFTLDDAMPKDTMWRLLMMGGQEADVEGLEEAVMELVQATTQKTAGQRKNKPNDIDWKTLDWTLWRIVMQATALVLSGELEAIKSK